MIGWLVSWAVTIGLAFAGVVVVFGAIVKAHAWSSRRRIERRRARRRSYLGLSDAEPR